MTGRPSLSSILNRVVIVSALGYFVDIYDLLLFSIVRKPSLLALGVPEARTLDTGVLLLNWQMGGLLLGGILWGVLGDKRGRVSVLFGSILLYSAANIANGFVTNVPTYAALRFLAGVGLAGELGAAVTLVSEVMTKETRGYGTAVVAGVGILGAVAANLVGKMTDWRTAYWIGGGLGLVLLAARFSLVDSGLYRGLARRPARRGDLRLLVSSGDRFARYAFSLLVGLPLWFVVGILITFSPELAVPLHIQGAVKAGDAVMWCYLGLTLGDFASGWLSGVFRSRRLILIVFLAITSALQFVYVFLDGWSLGAFYTLCFLLGIGAGYWAVFITNAAEQFGTNLRATVATTAPNFVRGSVVPLTFLWRFLSAGPPKLGLLLSVMLLGQATVLVALLAVRQLRETYGKDLDYVEGHGAAVPAAAGAVPS
jgi:MFS transporter, putative metabolite:H+ symporter